MQTNTPVSWHVEALSAADYDAIAAVWEAAGLPVKPGGRDSREQFARQMAADTQAVLGVRDGDRLIGLVVATHDGRKGWINRLAVHPDYRRQGVGLRLIDAAEQALNAQGIQVIAALIEDYNTASLALFERAGYSDYEDIHYVTKRDGPDV